MSATAQTEAMTMLTAGKLVKLFDVRVALPSEVTTIFADGGLGEQFFHESEFGDFTDLDLPRARETLVAAYQEGQLYFLVAYYKSELCGFIAFSMQRHYTTDPLGQLYLLYVKPGRRFGPLGRALIEGAEQVCRDNGCCVFYAGATANMGNGIDERMMNMLDKRGYLRLGGVARKTLQFEETVS